MTIVAGDILRSSVNFVLGDGSLFQNVYHHMRTGYGILSDQTHIDAIEDWVEAMYGQIVTVVPTTVTEQLCSVDRVAWTVDSWEVVENIGVFTPSLSFESTGGAMPNQISAFVSFKTARPKTVGRKFLFPMTENEQDSGIITEGTITKLVAWANLAVNNIVIQVLDDLVPGVPRTNVDAWHSFTVALVTNLLGTQRRRRPGQGA